MKEKKELHALWLAAGTIAMILGVATILLTNDVKAQFLGMVLVVMMVLCWNEANYIHLKYLGENPAKVQP